MNIAYSMAAGGFNHSNCSNRNCCRGRISEETDHGQDELERLFGAKLKVHRVAQASNVLIPTQVARLGTVF